MSRRRPSSIIARAVLLGAGAVLSLGATACSAGGGSDPSPGGSTADRVPAPTSSPGAVPVAPDGAPLSVVVFGDSWGFGAHCGGCTPWPQLLPAAYHRASGVEVALTDLTEDGGGSASLRDELEHRSTYRDAVAGADVVVVNVGINDLEQTVDATELGTGWRTNLGAVLDLVDELRAGRSTAVRMVGVSNEYLADPELAHALGRSAPEIFATFDRVSCEVAADHGDRCVDLRPVLNGPGGQHPADPDTQASMDAVAAAIAATGLAEVRAPFANAHPTR